MTPTPLSAGEKGEFDLLEWLEDRPDEPIKFPATVWQQLIFGAFAWQEQRARKRERFLETIDAVASVAAFSRAHTAFRFGRPPRVPW